MFLGALCNLDPYTITEDVSDHFAVDNNHPRENEFDFLTEAEAAFALPQPAKEKKPKKAPTPIKVATKKTPTKKKLAA